MAAPSTNAVGPELVFGLVRYLGIPAKPFVRTLEKQLRGYGYTPEVIKLSSLLPSRAGGDKELAEDQRLSSLIDAGNQACADAKDSATVARMAVSEIRTIRAETNGLVDGDEGKAAETPLIRTAYILDSLKRPAEATLLRRIYGDRFILISLLMGPDERAGSLMEKVKRGRPGGDLAGLSDIVAALIERDEAEDDGRDDDFGQAVRKTYHTADFFVDLSTQPALDSIQTPEEQLRRFFSLLFGDPVYEPPSIYEYAMQLASISETRTTALGRRVGAAIADKSGSVVALGYNEVPLGTKTDADLGHDTSSAEVLDLVVRTLEGLNDSGLLSEDAVQQLETNAVGLGRLVMSTSPLANLIEFQRPVHAEMAAILDATRRQVDTSECCMAVTAYCCHLCAKHIVALGFKPVVYLEPYPKSKARTMYPDLVEASFAPFVGVAPRRYSAIFGVGATDRKAKTGELLDLDPTAALPKVGIAVSDSAVIEAEIDEVGVLASQQLSLSSSSEPAKEAQEDE